MAYILMCWKHGMIGNRHEVHPLRMVQAMIRSRAADLASIDRLLEAWRLEMQGVQQEADRV